MRRPHAWQHAGYAADALLARIADCTCDCIALLGQVSKSCAHSTERLILCWLQSEYGGKVKVRAAIRLIR